MSKASKSKFALFDAVVAGHDIFEPELSGFWGRGSPAMVDGKPAVLKGTRGVVVEVFDKTGGLAVEFFDANGDTIDVAFLDQDRVCAQTEEEPSKSRAVTSGLNVDLHD